MLIIYIIFGFKFIRDSREFEKGKAQRAFFVGLGLFIISVAFGEGVYAVDLVSRTYTGERLFLGRGEWAKIVAYEIEMWNLVDKDYYIVVYTFILIALSFLMKPLERFMLRREKPVMTYLNRILIPFPFLIRFFEVNIANWFGSDFQVVKGSIYYYIFTGLWMFVLGVVFLSIFILVGLYIKMGLQSPKGSNLRKKCFLIILGISFWIGAVFFTATAFREIEGGNLYYIPVIPLLLILSLSCMMYGFKREF